MVVSGGRVQRRRRLAEYLEETHAAVRVLISP
jgi:hypothetical protein